MLEEMGRRQLSIMHEVFIYYSGKRILSEKYSFATVIKFGILELNN